MVVMAKRALANKRFNEQKNGSARAFCQSLGTFLCRPLQQREMAKFHIFWRTRTAMATFWYLVWN